MSCRKLCLNLPIMGIKIEKMTKARNPYRNTIGFITSGLWILLSLISLNHLFPFFKYFIVSTTVLGGLGWLTLTITIVFVAQNNLKQCLLVFIAFACLGYYIGPYLEPPVDPLEHLTRTYKVCEKNSDQFRRSNRGLWQYSMSGVILCSSKYRNATTMLRKIDVLHGLYCGLGVVVLFLLGRYAGFLNHWAFLSSLICFLFFGTNRFGYFSYYTLAASFSSMLIFWLWVTFFFFRKSGKYLFIGLFTAILGLPILWVNHQQEAVFLAAIALIWLVWNSHERLWSLLERVNDYFKRNYLAIILKTLYLAFIFVVLFILPQVKAFREILDHWFTGHFWEINKNLIYYWQGFHLFGKVWAYRVNDTLGFFGFLPLILIVPLLIPGFIVRNRENRGRLILLGILPFLGYFLPLLHFIWVSNNIPDTYYRFCYFSMFWLPICYLLHNLEGWLPVLQARIGRVGIFSGMEKLSNAGLKKIFFSGCLITIILVSSIRSGPIYGKLDFILLDSRPWWPGWQPVITSLLQEKNRNTIDTDPMTAAVFSSVFNQPAIRTRELSRHSILDIESMDERHMNNQNRYRCLINLHGFVPSWVPKETGHWQPDIGITSLYYHYRGVTGDALKVLLEENPPKSCRFFK